MFLNNYPMKIEINIDLRKRDALNLGNLQGAFNAAFKAMRDDYQSAARLGEPDPAKPGWYEHGKELNRLLNQARCTHIMLTAIAKLIGHDAAVKIKPLRWAIQHNGHGQPLPDVTRS